MKKNCKVCNKEFETGTLTPYCEDCYYLQPENQSVLITARGGLK